MNLSVITTCTLPEERQYPWREAIRSYLNIADEVLVVCGHEDDVPLLEKEFGDDIEIAYKEFPYEFKWDHIKNAKNAGLSLATGDFIISLDLDTIIDDGFNRDEIAKIPPEADIAEMLKMQCIVRDRGFVKSSIPAIIRNDRGVEYGWVGNNTFTRPISPNNMPDCKTPLRVYNYDHTLRTKKIAREEIERFGRAYTRSWGTEKDSLAAYGTSMNEYWIVFLNNVKGRLNSDKNQPLKIDEHPQVMHKTLSNLRPEQLGYDGWGMIDKKAK